MKNKKKDLSPEEAFVSPRLYASEVFEYVTFPDNSGMEYMIHVTDWHPDTHKPWHGWIMDSGKRVQLVELLAHQPVQVWMKDRYKDPVRDAEEQAKPVEEMIQTNWRVQTGNVKGKIRLVPVR